jgi:radical SAM superfamily enzyme YgiQ (UPF0313 family)
VDVQVLDAPAHGLDLDGFAEKLSAYRPDIVGLTTYTTTFTHAMAAAGKVKEAFPRSLVVTGGPHPSVRPEECLASPAVDVAVRGEGEETFRRLVECVAAGGDLNGVPNLVYKRNGEAVATAVEPQFHDPEALPFPARDLVDMRLYRPAHGAFRRLPATNMITSRGCPFQCSFCSKSISGSHYRAQSPGKTVQEIEALVRDYGIREVSFSDDVFTFDRRRTEALCGLLAERRLDITWSCSTRANLVSPELLVSMRKAGCVSVGYGIEAGDPEVLARVHKGLSLDKARDAIRWTREAGLESRAFYIFGFPGETRATLQKTLDVALELDADFVIFNLTIPLPGAPLYDEAKSQGLLLYDGVELYNRADGPHPLIRLEGVSEEELARFYRRAYRRYYLRPSYMLRQVLKVRSPSGLARLAKGFLSFVRWNRS